jgi:hypothetical protein
MRIEKALGGASSWGEGGDGNGSGSSAGKSDP